MSAGPDDLVVSTPERIAFSYETAGIGSRFLAQLVDGAVLVVLLVGTAFAAFLTGQAAPGQVAALVGLLLSFVVVVGYFWLSEAISGGRTLGKMAFRLRVVGTRGEPVAGSQVAIRNLVRIVDFLPVLYGVGVITLFANGRGRRLGDLAAGTTVIRERARIGLRDLKAPRPAERAGPAPGPGPADLDPALRRLVAAYATRRAGIAPQQRRSLAEQALPALQRVLPEMVAAQGPLAALDHLADQVT